MKTFLIILLSVMAIIILFFIIKLILKKVKYQMDWHPKAPKIKPNKKHIVCVGDSITCGLGVKYYVRYKDSYPAILNKKLGKDYQVLNYGLSGRTLLEKAEAPYTHEAFFDLSKVSDAKIVIIMLGTNDTKPHNWKYGEDFYQDYTNFIKSYQKGCPNASIYLMKLPRAHPRADGLIKHAISNETIVKIINPMIDTLAIENNCQVLDLYAVTKDHPEYFIDGIHPMKNGNEAIAEYIFQEITKGEN